MKTYTHIHAIDAVGKINPFRRFVSLILFIAVLFAGGTREVYADHPYYRLDISDAEVTFSVTVLGFVTVTGQFQQVEGGMRFTEACDTTDIVFRIQTASVHTTSRKIDDMIRGPSLLNSEQHPLITFSGSQVTTGRNGPERITGELFLNGVRRSVSFMITPEYDQSQRYHASTNIRRSDFGIPSPMIGTSDLIRIQVSLAIRQNNLMIATAETRDASR